MNYIEIKNKQKVQKKISPAGNRTPVSRVTGGDTNHYTTEDLMLKGGNISITLLGTLNSLLLDI